MARLIDRDNGVRTRPMRVICVGMCRTGTLGLYWALNALGYRTYHSVEALKDGERGMKLMRESYVAKYEEGKPYGRNEFDKWYGEFDAVCDVPAAWFVDELYAAYPDAKFILTDRDPDSWLRSMHNTAFACVKSPMIRVLGWLDWKLMKPFWDISVNLTNHWCGQPDDSKSRRLYCEHVEHVKATIPPEQLLYLRLEDGITWEKICPFLGLPIPDKPMPDGAKNGPIFFHQIAQDFFNRAILGMVKRWLVYSSVPMVAAGAWYVHRQPGALWLPW
ncbi:nad dependent epimerase [Diplodia corticola]|uniref:Nad dependent epimerase n=1 Tax=Diplodia corticola TaxID=236234 RepID=A0A1J9S3K0_9PEZI|nr:nad dependent epimerase [Diplodia corticola]OJD34205.1 nad dependent epimerase [Diplodia corticola]